MYFNGTCTGEVSHPQIILQLWFLRITLKEVYQMCVSCLGEGCDACLLLNGSLALTANVTLLLELCSDFLPLFIGQNSNMTLPSTVALVIVVASSDSQNSQQRWIESERCLRICCHDLIFPSETHCYDSQNTSPIIRPNHHNFNIKPIRPKPKRSLYNEHWYSQACWEETHLVWHKRWRRYWSQSDLHDSQRLARFDGT